MESEISKFLSYLVRENNLTVPEPEVTGLRKDQMLTEYCLTLHIQSTDMIVRANELVIQKHGVELQGICNTMTVYIYTLLCGQDSLLPVRPMLWFSTVSYPQRWSEQFRFSSD